MKTTIQALFTALVVAAVLFTGASTVTSCNTKKDDPAPTTTTAAPFVAVTSGTGVQLGDQNNGSLGSFFGSKLTGSPAFVSGSGSFTANIANIDMAFALQPNNSTSASPLLISPSAINLSTGFNATVSTIAGKNVTTFGTPSSAPAYSSLTGYSLTQLGTATSFTATSAGLSLNGTVFYKTAGGKYGAIYVNSLTSNGNSNNSSTTNSVTFSFIETK